VKKVTPVEAYCSHVLKTGSPCPYCTHPRYHPTRAWLPTRSHTYPQPLGVLVPKAHVQCTLKQHWHPKHTSVLSVAVLAVVHCRWNQTKQQDGPNTMTRAVWCWKPLPPDHPQAWCPGEHTWTWNNCTTSTTTSTCHAGACIAANLKHQQHHAHAINHIMVWCSGSTDSTAQKLSQPVPHGCKSACRPNSSQQVHRSPLAPNLVASTARARWYLPIAIPAATQTDPQKAPRALNARQSMVQCTTPPGKPHNCMLEPCPAPPKLWTAAFVIRSATSPLAPCQSPYRHPTVVT
jgi:hypothetical protein